MYLAPPVIEYVGLSIFTNDRLVIDCIVSGLPLPAINWSKDNNTLVNDDRTQISFNGSSMSRLTITAITSLDNGLYSCVGTSISGRITQELPIRIGKFMNSSRNAIARYSEACLYCDRLWARKK